MRHEQESQYCAEHDPVTAGSSRECRRADIIGSSPSMLEVMRQVRTVASTSSTVLIHGETGTGKELIARAVHELSRCSGGPFIKVNCAAIPGSLLEAELMGHERGAFTGAIARRLGRFEQAQNGTIFLDEIGELALDLQPKLLRLLEERQFERVGGSKTVHCNARLVAATNRNLAEMVRDGQFREDLFYRLSVFPVDLPPLRKRREDVALLARHFVIELCSRMGKPACEIPENVMARLMAHDWPGNIRELRNTLERAVIMATGTSLEVTIPASASVRHSPSDELVSVSRQHILSVLNATNWVVAGPSGAAARLGMKRSTLNFRMRKLGIERADGALQARKL